MKILGCIFIIISMSLIGNSLSKKTINKVNNTRLFIELLETIKTEITYNKSPLIEIIQQITISNSFYNLDIIKLFFNELKNGVQINTAWNKALKISSLTNIFDNEEIENISRIGNWIGNSSIEGQISNLDLTIIYLKQNLNNYIEFKNKYVKMYNTLGVLSGIALSILIW